MNKLLFLVLLPITLDRDLKNILSVPLPGNVH